MGANVWFWLIYVIIGVAGILGLGPWRTTQYPWAPFGSWLILFILIGILGVGVFGTPIR